jgi:hypothetical protein
MPNKDNAAVAWRDDLDAFAVGEDSAAVAWCDDEPATAAHDDDDSDALPPLDRRALVGALADLVLAGAPFRMERSGG